jgi:hypothetical protein
VRKLAFMLGAPEDPAEHERPRAGMSFYGEDDGKYVNFSSTFHASHDLYPRDGVPCSECEGLCDNPRMSSGH